MLTVKLTITPLCAKTAFLVPYLDLNTHLSAGLLLLQVQSSGMHFHSLFALYFFVLDERRVCLSVLSPPFGILCPIRLNLELNRLILWFGLPSNALLGL